MLRVVAKARNWCSILYLQSYSVSMDEYININKIAEIKGLTSNRSLRLAIQKGKYIAREVKVFGGTSYEILYSSLEPEVQEKLQDELIKEATQSNCTALVPLDTKPKYPTFIAESAKLTALARVDVVKALQNIRGKYKTKKEADLIFLDLYTGMLLPKVYQFMHNFWFAFCRIINKGSSSHFYSFCFLLLF